MCALVTGVQTVALPIYRKRLLRHLAAENAHHMAGTLATVHPDCVFRDFATGQVFPGLAGAERHYRQWWDAFGNVVERAPLGGAWRSEEHTSELQSLMRTSYAVFCLKKQKTTQHKTNRSLIN